MFDGLPGFLGVIVSLLGIGGALGGLAGVFAERRSKVIRDNLRETVEALQIRLDTQETDFEICKKRLQATENTIAVLSNQVTGVEAVSQLAKVLDRRHAEILEGLAGRRA